MRDDAVRLHREAAARLRNAANMLEAVASADDADCHQTTTARLLRKAAEHDAAAARLLQEHGGALGLLQWAFKGDHMHRDREPGPWPFITAIAVGLILCVLIVNEGHLPRDRVLSGVTPIPAALQTGAR